MLILADVPTAESFSMTCSAMYSQLCEGETIDGDLDYVPTTGEALAIAMLGDIETAEDFIDQFRVIRFCENGMSVSFNPETESFSVEQPKRRQSIFF